ncbi:MAG TPA: hypothetical protein VFN21_06240 [Acidimicrobiales bacterium]|nr:hypothetical protein [Acidimicrobiales bacterium]
MVAEGTAPGNAAMDRRRDPVRWTYRVIVALAVTPIVIAAIRNGVSGWQPTLDAGITAVRVRDVFSAHPPLVGLAAQTSFESSAQYSYLGAFGFYLLAVPVRLLGVTWGLLLGMAAINSAAVVAALWLVRRRVGERAAMLAGVIVASLLWTVGSQMLIEPTPVAAGIVPMFALLVAAWSVADGDAAALVVVAAIANYLVLGHPKFIVVVPLLCLYAVIMWVRGRLRLRADDPTAWRDQWKIDRRVLVGCGVLTALAWLPPLVDQFRAGGGNLGKAIHAAVSGQAQDLQVGAVQPTFTGALGMLTSVTAVPPAWLPPNFAHPPFDRLGGGTPFVVGLVCAALLVALLGVVVGSASRREDRTVVRAVATGVVAWIAYLITATQNPDAYGFRARYFYGLWPLAAYLWLVVAIGLVRACPSVVTRLRVRSSATTGGLVLAVLAVVGLSVPYADHAEAKSAPLVPAATAIRHTVATEMAGSGPTLVPVDFTTSRLWPAILLGLQDSDVPIRVSGPIMVQQFGSARDQDAHHDATRMLVLRQSSMPAPPGGRRIGTFATKVRLLSPGRFAVDTAKMRAWASSIDQMRINPHLVASRGMRSILDASLATLGRDAPHGEALVADPTLLGLLVTAQPFLREPIFDVPGMSADELALWATDAYGMQGETVLYEAPVPAG